MPRTPPRMTREEQHARTQAKRQVVLEFLASGEVFITIAVASNLLQLTRTPTLLTLEAMERDFFLKSETLDLGGIIGKLRLFGITPHGLAAADKLDSPFFELGRTSPITLQHKLDGQKLHIKALASGWTDWVPERLLREKAQTHRGDKLGNIPDALATDPLGRRVAIEVERNAKTPKRYQESIVQHLRAIKTGKYACVHYVIPGADVKRWVENAFSKVRAVRYMGETVMLTEQHRAVFRFFSYEDWPAVPNG